MAEPPNRRVKSRLIFDILSLTTKHMKFRIFISSVQREFARERRQLAEYIRKDLVFSKFFDVFLFEEIPAGDASPKAVYLKEVAKSDVYLSVQVMLFKDRLEIWNAGSLPRGWTVKNLFRPHTSLPPNELLAKPMYLKGYIEKTGTGTGDVIDYCRQWELPPPEFVEESDFRVILRRKTTTEPTEETSLRTTRKTTGKTTGKNQEFEARGALEKIRGLIVMNPRITIPEIARQLRLTEDGVFYHIRTLRAVAGLRREGGRKFGHWAFEEK